MPKVTIQKTSQLSPQTAFEKISYLLENDTGLKKLDPGLKCDFKPDQLTGTATGNQFTARLKVTGDATSSNVEIIVDLPFHLALIKGVVEKTLNTKIGEALS